MDLSLLGWGNSGWLDEFSIGMVMTFSVSIVAFIISLFFGVVFANFKLSSYRSLRIFGNVYTTVLRGIPELLVIYLFFFGGGALLRSIASALFGYDGYIDLPVFIIGALCIGLSSGAYSTEVIRGAILSVRKGQLEAAYSVGMSRRQVAIRILFPQAARYALPGLGNIWQFVLKDTSLISIVGFVEIIRVATLGAGSTKQPFLFYFIALLLFLFLAWISQRVFYRIEAWSKKGEKSLQ